MKIDKLDSLVRASANIMKAVKEIQQTGSYIELQNKLLDVSEFLVKQYETHNVPDDDIKEIMNEIEHLKIEDNNG